MKTIMVTVLHPFDLYDVMNKAKPSDIINVYPTPRFDPIMKVGDKYYLQAVDFEGQPIEPQNENNL